MNIHNNIKSVFFAFIFFTITLNIHSQVTISVELRPRAEIWDGYRLLNDGSRDPEFFISQRSRLNFNYTNNLYSIGFSIQDVRIWGDENIYSSTGVYGNSASVDLHEAWIELNLCKHSKLKVGRQSLAYDNQRMFAYRNWSQHGMAYNAIIYKYKQNDLILDLGLSFNNQSSNVLFNEYPSVKQKTMNYLYFKKQFNSKFNASLLAMGSGYVKNDSSNIIYMRGTYGANLGYKTKNIELKGSGYYQNGKNSKGLDVSAYLFSFYGQYKLRKFLLGAGIDYLSGQDATKTDEDYQKKDHLFDILYGKRHIVNGEMDMFFNIPMGTAGGGLVDVFATIAYYPVKALKLNIDYHFFSLQNNVLEYAGPFPTYLEKALGDEIDFDFKWTIRPDISLAGGYSFIIPTTSLEIIQGINLGQNKFSSFGWMMLTVKPTIFTSKK